MPPSSGTSLGTATGTVVINAQVTAAAQQIAQFSQQSEKELQRVTNAVNQLAGAFGVSLGAAGLVQLGKAAVASAELATAYNRQMVAAESLAGSQENLNALLDTYDKATGGILDKSTELANVTQLMSVGFADSARELDKFATAIRGISIATGRSADTITQNLILELFSQRGQRLDQLGLQYDKVRAKADELRAADSNLSKEQAYQNAVLEEAQRKYGDLAKSQAGAITGIEGVVKQTHNLYLEFGQLNKLLLDPAASVLAIWIAYQVEQMKLLVTWATNLEEAMSRLAHLDFSGPPAPKPPTGVTGGGGVGGFGTTPPPIDQVAVDKAWSDLFDKTAAITRQANADILSENASYQNRRLRSEEQYQENVAQSAADFAKGRMQAQEDYEASILDIMRAGQQRDTRLAEDHARDLARMQSDSNKRLADLQEDLDRNNAQKRADSADKVAEMAADHDDAIADKRADSADRLLDIEKDYARQQEDALRQHQTTRLEAAARLDARALFFEDRRFEDEQKTAAEAHTEKVDDEKTKLQKSLDNINESYNEKLADEQKALDKSINQANEAHDRQVADEKEALQQRIDDANDAYTRQLADAKAADEQRITDMAAHFKKQKDREDEDQRERMTRMANDHTAEMTQMDTEHAARITQIGIHAQDERDALDAEHRKTLHDLGVYNDFTDKAEKQHQQQIALNKAKFMEEEKLAAASQQRTLLQLAMKNPLIDIATGGLLDKAVKALDSEIEGIGKNIGALNQLLSELPANPYVLVPSATGTVVPASLGVGAAGMMTSAAGGGGVTVNTAFTINAVSGQTAQDLYTLIDARILRTVQLAARRL